jgi:opacity protein-like surface antigen
VVLNSKVLMFSVAVSAMGLISSQASAADAVDPITGLPMYVSVFGGASFLNPVKTDFYGSQYTVKSKTGYILGGAIGVKWNDMIRSEIELSHSSWTAKSYASSAGGPFNRASGNISATYLLGNVWLDWNNDSAMTPYVGGGLGVAWADADTSFFGNTYGYGPGEAGLAFQLGAGVKYDVTESIAIDVGYRFKGVKGIDFDDNDGSGVYEDADLNSHNVQVGLTFSF